VSKSENRTVVIIALAGNLVIAASKLAAAWMTGSSAMLSEGVHSLADTANEWLMLHGLKRANAPPNIEHPLGRGREVYFWSFIVALLIFALGATVSFYEGVHRWFSPKPVSHMSMNYAVLAISFLFEATSWGAALRRLRKTKGNRGYLDAMRRSKDPTIFTVLLEDSAALVGLVIAFIGITLAAATGRSEFDAAASVLIAVVLCITSFFLARETKALLIGEPAQPHVQASLMAMAERDPAVSHANGIITAQLGPDHVLAALSAEFEDHLNTPEIEACVQRLEAQFKSAHPEVIAVFIKPQTRTVWTSRRAILAEASKGG
jgi:cation diffusion facilitator family transporter